MAIFGSSIRAPEGMDDKECSDPVPSL
jgi:hypothetical protein